MTDESCKECQALMTVRNRSRVCEDCHIHFELRIFIIGLLGGAIIALIVKWGLDI